MTKASKSVLRLPKMIGAKPRKKRKAPAAFLEAGKKHQFKHNDETTGFKDPHINRRGYLKPKSQRELEQLLDLMFAEEVKLKDGGGSEVELTRLQLMVLNMMAHRDVRGQIELLDRRFGKTRIGDSDPTADAASRFEVPADVIAPEFSAVYRDIKAVRHVEYILRGGRGSTKSSFIAVVIIYLIKKFPTMHALCMRQVGNTLEKSVYNRLKWAINTLGLRDEFKILKSPLEITYIPTGQKIYFAGADDPDKVKSMTPEFGYIGILWLEELDQFRGAEAIRKIEQSAIRGGDVGFIFKSFNPPQTTLSWVNKYCLVPKESQYQHSSNYLGLPQAFIDRYTKAEQSEKLNMLMETIPLYTNSAVPAEWLGRTWLDEAEHLMRTNLRSYEHEYLGVINGLGTNVFDNITLRAITKREISGVKLPDGSVIGGFDEVLHGLDWGWYPDPAHYGQCYYDAAHHKLYLFKELRKWKMSNEDLHTAIVKECGYNDADLLIADSAEPKSVNDFRSYGANCRGAEKGPDSKRYSYKWLQSLAEIVIDPKACPHAAEEFSNKQFELTKDGEVMSEIPDGDDHSIDETRYATNLRWRRRGE